MRNSRNGTKNDGKIKKALLLVISAVVAIALGLTCALFYGVNKPSSVDGVGGDGEVSESVTTLSNLTGNDIKTKVMAGQLKKNDVINYSYTGSNYWTGNIRSVVLPKGTYTLEVWGAQGGTGKAGSLVAGDVGGKGGYSKGTLTLTAETTIYIVIGGRGTDGYGSGNPINYGGYNGGGTARGDCDSNGPAGSGGGATHIATDPGLLSALNGNRNAVLIVGGGGGGGGSCSGAGLGGYGGGGNSNGGNADNRNGYAATGGTTNGTPTGGAGGAGSKPFSNNPGWGDGANTGVTTTYGTCIRGANGWFGRGGDGGGPTNDSGAGGGGGWFGGGGGAGHSGGESWHSAGGGSGYVQTAKFVSGTTGLTTGGKTGSGQFRLTVINQPPTANQAVTFSNQKLGSVELNVASTTLAKDPDYSFTTGLTAASVYYFNSTSDYSGYTAAKVYIDSACTKTADSYLTYAFTNNQTLSITVLKKLPRAGSSDGITTNNSLKLYVRIRDHFNAYATFSFTINYASLTVTHGSNTSGVASNGYHYRFGTATTTSNAAFNKAAVDGNYAPVAGQIYSPTSTSTWALCVQEPIRIGTSVTVTAESLLAGTDYTNYKSYYQVLFVPAAANTAYYNYSGTGVTLYDFSSGSTYTAVTGYSSININAVATSEVWQKTSWTVYLVEKSSIRGNNYEPTAITYTGGQTLEVNFRIDNRRPTLKNSSTTTSVGTGASLTGNVLNVNVGATGTISLADILTDADDATVSASTHQIKEVKLADKEFVQLDKYGNVKTTVGSGAGAASYYNVSGGAMTNALKTGTSEKATGFNPEIAVNTDGATVDALANAFIKYNVSTASIEITGIRSSYSQYDTGRTALTAYTGGTTAAPTGSVAVANPGHFYLLVRVQDHCDKDDGGIWMPLAVAVGALPNGSAKPVDTGSAAGAESGQTQMSNLPTAAGEVGDTFYFTPMGLNIGTNSYPVGKYVKENEDGTRVLTNENLKPLAVDGDSFSTLVENADGEHVPALSQWENADFDGKLNELLRITSSVEQIVGTLGNNLGEYIKVSYINIYLPMSYFGGRVRVGTGSVDGVNYLNLATDTFDGVDYYVIDGLKIELVSATMNRYFHASVRVADSSGLLVNDDASGKNYNVEIAVFAENTAPNGLNKSEVAEWSDNVVYSADTDGSALGIPTITYRIPMYSTFVFTPYDLIGDYDISKHTPDASFKPAGGFTLNGLSGGVYSGGKLTYDGGAAGEDDIEVKPLLSGAYGGSGYRSAVVDMLAALDSKAAVNRLATDKKFATAVSASNSVYKDKLFFSRVNDTVNDAYTFNPTTVNFVSPVETNTDGFIRYYFGNKIAFGGDEYGMDFILVAAASRTSQPAQLELTVRDRYGYVSGGDGTITVRVNIEVVNTAPAPRTDADAVKSAEIRVKPLTVDNGDGSQTTVTPSSATISVGSMMSDLDGDTLSFIMPRGVIVANTPNLKTEFPALGSAFDAVPAQFLEDGMGNRLSDCYVSARLNSSDVLYVEALGSTKNLENGVWVYFFVSDGRAETLWRVQIEVLNTTPEYYATGDYAFELDDNGESLWTIESTSVSDITRERYIAGSETAAELLKTDKNRVNADIKVLATDADRLQRMLLSPMNGSKYVNLVGTDYENAVPDIEVNTGIPTAGGKPVAVAMFKYDPSVTDEDGNVVRQLFDVDDVNEKSFYGYAAELVFYVNNAWITRTDLLNDAALCATCFDVDGRWNVTEWAIRMQASISFEDGVKLGVVVSMRDEAVFGGDTAGEPTAFPTDRTAEDSDGNAVREVVSGAIEVTFYQTITGTGIRTKDEFDKFGGYYTVEDAQNSAVAYVPNTDGASAPATFGSAYTDVATDAAYLQNAYNYPTVIKVPEDTQKSVYVPMSFFGALLDMTTPKADEPNRGSAIYNPNGDFVGYNIDKTQPYERDVIGSIAAAISISDGTETWTGGSSAKKPLNDNPYVTFDAFDDYSADGTTSSATKFADALSKPYYNDRLSVPVIDGNGDPLGYALGSTVNNGKVMHLAEQATKLQEHNFGLVLNKNVMRTGTRDITLTVRLAKARKDSAGKDVNIATKSGDVRSVTVNIRVENGKFDLVDKNVDNSYNNALEYDEDKGTYYTDVSMPSATSTKFALIRSGSDAKEKGLSGYSGMTKLLYSDGDYRADTDYRDYAYFSSDTVSALSEWSSVDNALPRTEEGGAFANTASSDKAQSSMLNFYGVSSAADAEALPLTYQPNGGKYGTNTDGNVGGVDGYSSYFTVAMSENGRVFNIMSVRKTYINESELKTLAASELGYGAWDGSTYGGLTQGQLAELYAKRGMVVEFNGGDDTTVITAKEQIKRVYYPFKAMVYDSCGVGWNEAAYVALEFRVTVTNATPALSENAGKYNPATNEREYKISLSAGSSVSVNLTQLINDSDIFKTDGGMLATSADFDMFARGVDRETKDYLRSPFAYLPLNENQQTVTREDGSKYVLGGGLSIADDDTMSENKNDVIMWMETADSLTAAAEPLNNYLHFTVVRRSSVTNEFRFRVYFCDNHSMGNANTLNGKTTYSPNAQTTQYITFVINVTNQAPTPTAKVGDNTVIRNITMRAGDDFTVLATYYDTFIGGVAGGSIAYNSSETGKPGGYYATASNRNANNNKEYWQYESMTAKFAAEYKYKERADITGFVADSTDARIVEHQIHLGYVGLATDDTPWRLRISDYSRSSSWAVTPFYSTRVEGAADNSYALAIRFVATSVCRSLPFSVTVIDGEGGTATYVFYITIVSQPPVPIEAVDGGIVNPLLAAAHLEGETDENGYIDGTYRLFGIPTSTSKDVVIDGVGARTAYGKFVIGMQNVASDPDGAEETEKMTLYNNGMFFVNGVALERDSDGKYVSEYFYIELGNGSNNSLDYYKYFTITMTGYNPQFAYETLTFYIADPGNGDFDNTLAVTIRVYTVYSDLTNPTVAGMTDAQYDAYLGGSETVHVKPYDEYMGIGAFDPDNVNVASEYAFIKLNNADGTPSVGNDGNTASHIVDPDVSTVGGQSYAARMYAFIDENGKPLSKNALRGLLKRDADTDMFVLDPDKVEETGNYMIGGVDEHGNTLAASAGAAERLAFVNRYADFYFSIDGTRVMFTPHSSTLNDEVLLYVEMEKQIGQRDATRSDGMLKAGSLFRLIVDDSAPRAVNESESADYNRSFVGAKGDSVTFKVYDSEGSYGALFVDSDRDDDVTVVGFDGENDAAAYETAFRAADKTLDWRATDGKPRAITVTKAVTAEGEMLTLTVNRRIDVLQNGKYLDRVTFPFVITGRDIGVDGAYRTSTAVIMITVCNTEATAIEDNYSKLESDSALAVGYSYSAIQGEYVIDAQVVMGKDVTVELADFMRDVDYTAGADTDSYRFAEIANATEGSYLLDKPVTAYYYRDVVYDDKVAIATVTPLMTDEWHYTGFKIAADSRERNLTATLSVRILDRSSANNANGITVTINITVMNEAPFVKENMQTTNVVMVGSETGLPENITLNIADYVDDKNTSDVTGSSSEDYPETYLRIFSSTYLTVDSLYWTGKGDSLGSSNSIDDSSSLFTCIISSDTDTQKFYNQQFIIQPHQGFYGKGVVEITVSDGSPSERFDTLLATFRINVEVVYDAEQLPQFNTVQLARGKTVPITIGAIMPDIENKLPTETRAAGSFNPSSAYELLSVVPHASENPTEDATDYLEITHEEGSSVWSMRARKITAEPKTVDVTYALKSDPEKIYRNSFKVVVVENERPTLKYNEIKFVRYSEEENADAFTLDTTNTAYLRADQILSDKENDVLTYISVRSQKPSLVSVRLSDSKDMLIITFAGRGSSEIVLTVADETDESVALRFTVSNDDLPQPSFWVRLVSGFESNKVVWAVIAGLVLLLLIILIVIIAVVKKRKRAREELEALLVSEMEIEEQMLKLAGGPTPTGYQSYGYLQSPQDIPADPSLMLGAGTGATSDPLGYGTQGSIDDGFGSDGEGM